MIVKVCGMRSGENIAAVDALGVDLMGFIFYPRSARYVDSLPSVMPSRAARVGVFVNPTLLEVEQRIELFGLGYVQLHGAESPEFCAQVAAAGAKVIKAFSVGAEFDFAATEPYAEACSLFLFDTATASYGGSGEQFDWSILEHYRGFTPFLLSGGIGPQNVDAIKALEHDKLAGYDINSRFEVAPALKDVSLVAAFVEQLK